MLRVLLYTRSKTLNPKRYMGLGWFGKFCRKIICTSFNQSSLILDQSSQADLHSKSCRTLDSNFTYKHILWASLNKTKTFWSWFSNITKWSSNTLVPNSLEPNTIAHTHTQNDLAESLIKRLQIIARPLLMKLKLPISA